MISLSLRDVRKDYLFVIRVYGKELIKVDSRKKLNAVVEALNVLGIENKNIHCYKININKVVL